MYHHFCHLNLWNCLHFQLKETETTVISLASYEKLMWLDIKNVNGEYWTIATRAFTLIRDQTTACY